MKIQDIIDDLKKDNEECYKDCEGACSQIYNSKCACQNAYIVSYLEELRRYKQ